MTMALDNTGPCEIAVPMPRQSMLYQVSHQRRQQHAAPSQDGSRVHAPTFLPEIGTIQKSPVSPAKSASGARAGVAGSVAVSPSHDLEKHQRTPKASSSSSLRTKSLVRSYSGGNGVDVHQRSGSLSSDSKDLQADAHVTVRPHLSPERSTNVRKHLSPDRWPVDELWFTNRLNATSGQRNMISGSESIVDSKISTAPESPEIFEHRQLPDRPSDELTVGQQSCNKLELTNGVDDSVNRAKGRHNPQSTSITTNLKKILMFQVGIHSTDSEQIHYKN